MRIVLLGAPGSGKGTQAAKLSEYYGIPIISSASVLKEATNSESAAGLQAKAYQDHNQHVPDEILLLALRDRFLKPDIHNGFLLAGFPRTTAQADTLDGLLEEINLPLDLVLRIEGDPDHFMERLEGRRICQSCGAMYNVFTTPPTVEGICDQCGGRVKRRADDNEETIANRMRIYDHQSASLIRYYTLHGKLRQINGDDSDETVFTALCQIIDEHPPTIIETEPVIEPPVPIDLPPPTDPGRRPEADQLEDQQWEEPLDEEFTDESLVSIETDPGEPEEPEPKKKEAALKKKRGVKRSPAKKLSATPEKRAATKKSPVKKKPSAKKTTAKKAVAKKTVAKKTASKRPIAGKRATTGPKRSPTKKVAAKRSAPKRPSSTKKVVKKAAPKRSTTKKAVTKKSPAKKAPPKKSVAKKRIVKKAIAKKSTPGTAKKSPVKRRVAKKAPMKPGKSKKKKKSG